jgi:hypothetical protein
LQLLLNTENVIQVIIKQFLRLSAGLQLLLNTENVIQVMIKQFLRLSAGLQLLLNTENVIQVMIKQFLRLSAGLQLLLSTKNVNPSSQTISSKSVGQGTPLFTEEPVLCWPALIPFKATETGCQVGKYVHNNVIEQGPEVQ